MIEKERAEFGCFSNQISREWHMGHAAKAKASVGLGSDPRSSRGPGQLQRFMIRGPTVLAPLTDGGAMRRLITF